MGSLWVGRIAAIHDHRTANIDYNIDEDGADLVEFRKGDEVRLVIRKAEYIISKQNFEKK